MDVSHFFLVGRISENFIADWQSGKLKPTEKELWLLKKGCDEVLEAFSGYLKSSLLVYRYKPYDIHYAEAREKISLIRDLIRQGNN